MTLTNSERGRQHHASLERQLLNTFPNMSDAQRKYAQNKISQILRKCKCDVIKMWISDKPFRSCQYEQSHCFLVSSSIRVYMNIQMD